MKGDAAHLAQRLAEDPLAVCRHYLSEGRRCGGYWVVGDVHNNRGRSLYVRLTGPTSGPGAAGKWTDAATAEHGDLLDLIALNLGHTRLKHTLEEARRFLGDASQLPRPSKPRPRDAATAARRLFARSRAVPGTLAEAYLRARGISIPLALPALRFNPACYYRADEQAPLETWPALIAAVTDLSGNITGVQRTWLSRDGAAKAPILDPRRSMGNLLGNAVRFGDPHQVLAAGEGIETMLAIKTLLPHMPVAAALSASHLAALLFPASLRRLYIAVDRDPAGRRAARQLAARSRTAALEAHLLLPRAKDWNADLTRFPFDDVLQHLIAQLAPHEAVCCAPTAVSASAPA
jgi:hypothetical protein